MGFKDFLLAEKERKLSSYSPKENNSEENLSEDIQSPDSANSAKTEE